MTQANPTTEMIVSITDQVLTRYRGQNELGGPGVGDGFCGYRRHAAALPRRNSPQPEIVTGGESHFDGTGQVVAEHPGDRLQAGTAVFAGALF